MTDYSAKTEVEVSYMWPDREVSGVAAPTLSAAIGEEAVFINRLRAGDDAAYDELVRRYGSRLLSTARRVLGNEDDARDAVQEGFLCAFKAIERFSGDSKISTWLHRIVVNAALMKLRGKRRKPEQSIDDLLPSFDDSGHMLEVADEAAIPADAVVEQREVRLMVRNCIDELPEAYRTVLILRDIEELDTEEVADQLGITSTAVRVRLHRARQALRTLLERNFKEA